MATITISVPKEYLVELKEKGISPSKLFQAAVKETLFLYNRSEGDKAVKRIEKELELVKKELEEARKLRDDKIKLLRKLGVEYEPPKEKISYLSEFNEPLRKSVRCRDNYICQVCGKLEDEFDKHLCVHHIDYDKTNNSLVNLISVCVNCHPTTNFNREKWIVFFKEHKRIKGVR